MYFHAGVKTGRKEPVGKSKAGDRADAAIKAGTTNSLDGSRKEKK